MSLPGPPKHPGSREWIFEGAAESPGLVPALTSPHRQVEWYTHKHVCCNIICPNIRQHVFCNTHRCCISRTYWIIYNTTCMISNIVKIHTWINYECFLSPPLPCFADSAVLISVTFREIWRRSRPSSRCWFSPWRSIQGQSLSVGSRWCFKLNHVMMSHQ